MMLPEGPAEAARQVEEQELCQDMKPEEARRLVRRVAELLQEEAEEALAEAAAVEVLSLMQQF